MQKVRATKKPVLKQFKEKRKYPHVGLKLKTSTYVAEYFRLNPYFVPAPYEIGWKRVVL